MTPATGPAAPPADPAEVALAIRDALTPLVNSLQIVRMVAGEDPWVAAAFLVIDRQTDRLGQLADEMTGTEPGDHEPARPGRTEPHDRHR